MRAGVWSWLRANHFFFLAFLCWMAGGGLLLFLYSREELFFAVNSRHHPVLDLLMGALSGLGRGDCIPFLFLSLLLLRPFREGAYLFATVGHATLSSLLIGLSKQYFGCPRPLLEYGIERVHTVPWLDNAFYNSFPSGHTFGAFGTFALLSFYLPARQRAWSVVFLLLALGCGYSRIYLGQHFLKDVYFGSLYGVLTACFLYWLAARIFKSSSLHA